MGIGSWRAFEAEKKSKACGLLKNDDDLCVARLGPRCGENGSKWARSQRAPVSCKEGRII